MFFGSHETCLLTEAKIMEVFNPLTALGVYIRFEAFLQKTGISVL